RRVAHAAAGGAVATEHLADRRAGAGADAPARRDAAGGRLAGGIALVRPGSLARLGRGEVEDDRGRHQRDHADRRGAAEPALFEPAHHAVRGGQPERAPAGEEHGGRALGVGQRREPFDLAGPRPAAAHLDPAAGAGRSDDDRASRATIGVGPVSDRKALGGRERRREHAVNDASHEALTTMRLLEESTPDDPALDLAVSHALLRRVAARDAPATMRLYRPGPTVAFGRL